MKLGRLRHAITYEAIQQCHAEKDWGICWLCGQVGITRASYYQWLKRDVPKAEKENEIIAQLSKSMMNDSTTSWAIGA